MDLEHYRNFITIVESGSLSAAAEKIHIAQPALTAQIKALQKKYGAPLLHLKRGVRNIELTDAGSILYNKAKFLCTLEDDAQREITACANGLAGTLRISLSPSMSVLFIQNFLSRFSKENPDIDYELYEVPIMEQTHQLLSGITEIGIANAPLEQAHRFEVLMTKSECLAAVYHKDSSWLPPDLEHLTLDSLEEVPLCLSRGCSNLFLNVCKEAYVYPKILSINTTKLSTIMWAKQKAGVAIVPVGTGESFSEELFCRPIQDDRLNMNKTLCVVKGRPLSAVARNFLSFYSQLS
jgi:DNA-binding transcriptional LysR family regulator